MDALLSQFNELGEGATNQLFMKFNAFPVGTDFHILSFARYQTKFGTSVVVTTDDYKFNLPRRFEKLFDTDEKLEYWNAQKHLRLKYNGIRNNAILITIE